MLATDRKSEDRQLANALTASGYKTRKEKLRERLLKCIKRNPTNPPAACAEFLLEIQKARDFDDLWVLFSDNAMDGLLIWARQIQEEENARLRPKIVSSRRDAGGTGPSYGASPVSRHPSAGPVRGGAALSFKKRAMALDGIGIAVTKSLYDTIIFDGKPLGDWTKDELAPIIDRRDVHSKFARLVMEQSLTSGPLRTANMSPDELESLMLQAKASVGV